MERLGGVLNRIAALLQATWPDAENVEKPLVFLALWSPGRSWKRLGASWKLLLLSMLVLMLLQLVRRASWWLKASWSRLGCVLEPLEGLLEPRKTS